MTYAGNIILMRWRKRYVQSSSHFMKDSKWVLETIYNSYIHPYFLYLNFLWGDAQKKPFVGSTEITKQNIKNSVQ